MRAHFGLPSVAADDAAEASKWRKRSIQVAFEIPYFTVSGMQVRYLKILEKSGYAALPVRACPAPAVRRLAAHRRPPAAAVAATPTSAALPRCSGCDILRRTATTRSGCQADQATPIPGGPRGVSVTLRLIPASILLSSPRCVHSSPCTAAG